MKHLHFQRNRSKKAVSAVITTIILTGILLTILVVASFVSLNILAMQVSSTEFEQAKTNMLLLDDTVQDVSLRSGSGGYVQFNEQNGGIGITKATETVAITANPGKTYLSTKPITAGHYSQWTVIPPSADRAAALSDESDATYLSASTTNKVETQKLAAIIPRPSGINYIIINEKASATQPKNEFQIVARINSVDYHSASIKAPNNNYNTFTQKYTINPATGLQWTWTDLSNLEVGCNLTFYSGGEVRVSEFWVTVDFTPPTSTTTIHSGSLDLYELVYSAGSQTSSAPTVLRGVDFCTVSVTDEIGYLRVEQDQGAKIKLDYNRVRVANQTLVDPYTNMVQISFIKLVKGDWGGSGTIHLKIQNTKVDSTPHVIPSGNVTLGIQMGSSATTLFFDKYANDPNVLSTVIIFSEVTVEASTT